jgi:hypothetical protein
MSGDIKTTQVSLPHSATGINSEDPAPAQETDLHEIQEKETEDIQVDNYNENEYITGLQLLTVMASLTVVAFVLMLDTTILSTVSFLIPMLERAVDSSPGGSCHYQ